MQFNVPPDLEILVQKRVASGRFRNAEEVFRSALESMDSEDSWITVDSTSLDTKIDRALAQVAAGRVYGPDEARRKLAALRENHLAALSR